MRNTSNLYVTIQENYRVISGKLFLGKVNQIIFSHIDCDDFKIECLCKKMHISRMQLHRKLKVLSGLSTSAYIRMVKLQRATELLQTTDLTISQIAYELGFKDPSYFTRIFVKEFRFPPSQLRKRWINGRNPTLKLQ